MMNTGCKELHKNVYYEGILNEGRAIDKIQRADMILDCNITLLVKQSLIKMYQYLRILGFFYWLIW